MAGEERKGGDEPPYPFLRIHLSSPQRGTGGPIVGNDGYTAYTTLTCSLKRALTAPPIVCW
jgi:hypothetical protein